MKAKQYAQELAMWNTIDAKMDIAERYHADRIVMKVFGLLQRAVSKSKVVSMFSMLDIKNHMCIGNCENAKEK